MTEELMNKLKKLKALADKGYKGEKIAAEVMLAKLLTKYNIQEEDLLEDTITEHEFQFWGEMGQQLFSQIVAAVMGFECPIYHYSGKRNCKTRFVYCTNSQAIEIKEMFEFYRNHLDEGFKKYYKAFVQVEHIFPADSKPRVVEGKEADELDDIMRLAHGIDKHERYLKLTE